MIYPKKFLTKIYAKGLMNTDTLSKYLKTDFLYDQLPGGFISYHPDGSILRVNETFCKWMNISNEDICKLNFRSILNQASQLYYDRVIIPILDINCEANEVSLTFNSSNGEVNTLFNAVSYKDESGGLILINASITKITGRENHEILSNRLPNQIWTISADGECIFVNEKVKDYFGEQPMSFYTEFGGVAEADRAKCHEVWKSSLEKGKIFEREIRLKGISQKEEWFFVSIIPYFNEEGKIESWFGSCTNIHKQKMLQIANYSSLSLSLTSAHKTLAENRQLFTNLAYSHSHMIRKPLANIIGLTQLLEYEELTEESRDLFKMLQTSVQELDEMIKIASNTMITPTY